MSELDYGRLADELLKPTLRAGAVIMGHRERGFAVEVKADESPVTAADRDAEGIMLEALAQAAPGLPVVAEEETSRGAALATGDTFFLVDPLDGTREFVSGGTDFTINVGLVTGGTPGFGLIYAPALGQLVVTIARDRAIECAVAPDAAVRRISDLSGTEIHTRDPDLDHLVAVASRSHLTSETRRFLDNPRVTGCRNIGSSLKFCLVARGEADLYPRFGETCEWDTAAGQAILQAAGGLVTTVDGQPLRYGKSEHRYVNPAFIAWGRPSLIPLFAR